MTRNTLTKTIFTVFTLFAATAVAVSCSPAPAGADPITEETLILPLGAGKVAHCHKLRVEELVNQGAVTNAAGDWACEIRDGL